SVGKANAVHAIRSALAMGADRGLLVKTDKQLLDSDAAARALKKAIERDGDPDLILTGKQSADSEGMQTHYRLAAAFGAPAASEAVSLTLADGKAEVTCEMGGGERAVMEMTLPGVIGVTKGLNEPRYPKLPDILKAKRKKIKEIDISQLEITPRENAARLIALEAAPERSKARMLNGSTRESVEELVRILREEENIL
ncbi:MAG: electron transfer flavoprotein subunit beta/FixA family protein, partial [Desulfobacterales bacterium]|nr:electron transfer flavoprotein subunit beta/FixA family protein [Desulfobacterales bacterium]